jgi:hypothetical protein
MRIYDNMIIKNLSVLEYKMELIYISYLEEKDEIIRVKMR